VQCVTISYSVLQLSMSMFAFIHNTADYLLQLINIHFLMYSQAKLTLRCTFHISVHYGCTENMVCSRERESQCMRERERASVQNRKREPVYRRERERECMKETERASLLKRERKLVYKREGESESEGGRDIDRENQRRDTRCVERRKVKL